MKRKILSLILVFAMTVSLLTVGTGAVEPTYGDTAGHWAESSIERWSAYGIIQGSNGLFDPNGQLTCAQLATILAKLLKLPAAKDAGFTDNTADAWYYDAINRCAAAGILNGNGDGTVTPEAPITRERAMVMLARALGIEPIRKPDLTKYTDAAQVSAYAQGYVAALIEAGIVGGVTADELAPQDNITRAATVTILDRAIDTYADEAGATVKADGKGLVLVVAENVKITNAPEGTKIVVADGATGLTVNGKSVSDDQTYIVPKTTTSSGSSSGGYSHSHSYVYTDNGDGTHTGRCYANDSTLVPEAHNHDGENGACSICGAKQTTESVASVKASDGTCTYYSTLPGAVAAAADGATIALLNNVELSAALEISAGKTVTLDLNGKKLSTTTKTGDDTRHYYAIDNYGTFTLQDSSTEQSGEIRARGIENFSGGKMVIKSGKIVAVDANGGAAIWNLADLTIEGGTFEAKYEGTSSDDYGPGCVYSEGTVLVTGGAFESANKRTYAFVSKTGSVTITPAGGKTVNISGAHGGLGIDGGTAIINGGNYSSSEYYGLYVSNDSRGANVTVNDGSFTGKDYSVWIGSDGENPVDSTLTINGGTFDKPINEQENAAGKLKVTGGRFSSDPSAYVAEGYITLVNGDGTFTVSDTNEIPVTTATVQDYLDGKYGSINGKTLVLASGDYSALKLAPAAYAGSNTRYTCPHNDPTNNTGSVTFTSVVEYKQHMSDNPHHGSARIFTRTLNNLTITAQNGAEVTIAGFEILSRTYDGDSDPFAEGKTGYEVVLNVKNLTFSNVKFTAKVEISSTMSATTIDGVTFNSCVFETEKVNNIDKQALNFSNSLNNGNVRNLKVDECKFNNCYQGVYTNTVKNILVTSSEFSGIYHNAIAVQTGNGADDAVNHGNVVISGNNFTDINDRIIRFNKVGAGTHITITNNAATNCNAGKEAIKAESLDGDVTYTISGNNWGNAGAPANNELKDSLTGPM